MPDFPDVWPRAAGCARRLIDEARRSNEGSGRLSAGADSEAGNCRSVRPTAQYLLARDQIRVQKNIKVAYGFSVESDEGGVCA